MFFKRFFISLLCAVSFAATASAQYNYDDPMANGGNGYDELVTDAECRTALERAGIDDQTELDELLAENNFELVTECTNGNSVFRCRGPQRPGDGWDEFAEIMRACFGVENVLCLNGGLDINVEGLSRLQRLRALGERRRDEACQDLSEQICTNLDLNWNNECQLPVYDPDNNQITIDLMWQGLGWLLDRDGNSVVHCFHGRDRTGTISALLLALMRCVGLGEPDRTECIENVHSNYLLAHNPPFDPDVYPALENAFWTCAAELDSDDLPPPPSPTPEESPMPTPDPTPMPTPDESPMPTPDPTPMPTPDESPMPTPDPTPMPPPEESPMPTPDPTPMPTPEESPMPTPDPTPMPIPEESPMPTPYPTPMPTPDESPDPAYY